MVLVKMVPLTTIIAIIGFAVNTENLENGIGQSSWSQKMNAPYATR